MIPQRKLPAKKAKSVFYRDVNDIDVFVEDTSRGTEKLYSVILSKAFYGKYAIKKVHPLGGKMEVAEAWENRNKRIKRKELYIIDADFSLYGIESLRYPYNLSGKSFFILKRFSIESYLIDENAVVKFLDDEDMLKHKSIIKRELKFEIWLNKNRYQLYRLFIQMATVRALDESVAVKCWNYSDIICSDEGTVCREKITNICQELEKNILLKVTNSEYTKMRKEIQRNLTKTEFDPRKHICSKEFLFSLLILRMKKVTLFKENTKLLKQKIASRLDGMLLVKEFKNAI